MDKIQKLLIGIVIVWLIVLSVLAATNSVPTPQEVAKDVSSKLGALVGPDIPYTYIGVNGLRVYPNVYGTLATATTTFCSIQSPAATSTLVRGGIQVDTSSTSPMIIELSKGNAPNASTTLLSGSRSIATSSSGFVNASTTETIGANAVFAPSTWFIAKAYPDRTLSTMGIGTFSPTGVCHATFEAYQ